MFNFFKEKNVDKKCQQFIQLGRYILTTKFFQLKFPTAFLTVLLSSLQYDDAFTPKRLGNWESTAKESYPFIKSPKQLTPRAIVDTRGHLLPWVQRDKNTLWGLLNHHLRNKHNRARSMALSGPGKQTNINGVPNQAFHQTIRKRLRKLPKFAPRKVDTSPPPDLLLEYLKHLGLPIVWIIGPSTKYTFQKRKQFSKQLATCLGFGYVSLEDKVQEWKDRQQICTCGSSPSLGSASTGGGVPSSPPTGPLHSLALTSIAPSKLPTNVPPFISPNIPSPPDTSPAEANEYILSILESQRIAFDTAMPIERNKILELYKFAMAECLPCNGFIMDSVPFDLVEGLQFEKVFYPAALAIYFTEGVPQKKQKVKPKDRRITATATSIHTEAKKNLMSPLDFLERNRRQNANVYLRPRSHKRLGTFSLAEGDKICKHFGGKTIRIINAEDVEKDTMEFLNELVKKNLDRYQDIIEGKCKLDLGHGGHREEQLLGSVEIVRSRQPQAPSPVSSTYSSTFIHEAHERALERLDELEDVKKSKEQAADKPPALVTAHLSETSLLTMPNIFTANSDSSVASSPRSARGNLEISEATQVKEEEVEKVKLISPSSSATKTKAGHFGAGDHVVTPSSEKYIPGRRSAELWERIIKLESKVAQLSTQEEDYQQHDTYLHHHHHHHHNEQECEVVDEEEVVEENEEEIGAFYLPPPTAYASEQNVFDKQEEEKFTAAIRNAIGPNYCSPSEQEFNYFRDYQEISRGPGPPPPDFDYGASGDCGDRRISSGSDGPPSLVSTYPEYYQSHSQQPKERRKRKNKQMYDLRTPPGFEEDPFYD